MHACIHPSIRWINQMVGGCGVGGWTALGWRWRRLCVFLTFLWAPCGWAVGGWMDGASVRWPTIGAIVSQFIFLSDPMARCVMVRVP